MSRLFEVNAREAAARSVVEGRLHIVYVPDCGEEIVNDEQLAALSSVLVRVEATYENGKKVESAYDFVDRMIRKHGTCEA